MSYLDKLLAGRPVTWKPLGEVAEIKHGTAYKHLHRGKIPVYGSGGIMTYVDQYVYDKPTVLIPRKGSLGNLFYLEEPFWNVDTIYYTKIDSSIIIPKLLYYYLQTQHLEKKNNAGGVPSLTQELLKPILIPIPPRDVQEEIVRVLDRFTELEAELETELEAELEARQKQYAYYRDLLLTSKTGDNIKWITLGEIGEVCMCKRVLKSQTSQDGEVPFFKIGTFGKTADSFIRRQLFEEYKSKYPFPNKGEILLSASGTIGRAVVFNGQDAYYQDSNIVWLHHDESKVLNRYLYYCYQIAKWKVAKGGTIQRLYNNDLLNTKIPVPFPDNIKKSLEEQERIVGILDRLETLAHSISKGLPRELELRRMQYSYYRDLLLTFPLKTNRDTHHETLPDRLHSRDQ